MAAVAGAIGLGQATASICGDNLRAQSAYGSGTPQTASFADATFGASDPSCLALTERFLIAADIRLYNRDELASALGSESRALSDAGLFAAAWQTWGKACFDRIVGDYAVAVYESDRQVLTLARDPTGQFPLFFKSGDNLIAFASMPSGLIPVLRPSAVNQAQVARFLMRQQVDQTESFFEGIHNVRAGELVEFKDGRLQRRFHWEPSLEPNGSDKDYVERYRSLLDQAVASRTSGQPSPIATQLSSGWDSSAVAATAARLAGGNRVIAFTAAPLPGVETRPVRHRSVDESALASATAHMHRMDHVIVRDGGPVFEVAQRQSMLAQEPVRSPFNMIWWAEIRGQAREAGAHVLLTGELGNLTLNMGGLYALEELIRRGDWAAWMREAIKLTRRHDVRWRGVLLNSFLPWIPDKAVAALYRMFLSVPAAQETSFLRRHQLDRIAGETDSRPLGPGFREIILRSLRQSDFGTRRKAALAEGIDECDPLSDRRIIEFALRLPVEQLVSNGQLRPLARQALSDRVPAAVLDAQQRGLQGADWHLRITQAEARNALDGISGSAAVQELLDLEKMGRAIDRWPSDSFNELYHTAIYRNGLVNALLAGIFVASHPGQRSP